MDPDKLNEMAKQLVICYKCGEAGHPARTCKEPKPVCEECGGNHLTMFHAFLARRNKSNAERLKTSNAPHQNNQTQKKEQGGNSEAGGQLRDEKESNVASTATQPAAPVEQPKPQSQQDGSGGKPSEL